MSKLGSNRKFHVQNFSSRDADRNCRMWILSTRTDWNLQADNWIVAVRACIRIDVILALSNWDCIKIPLKADLATDGARSWIFFLRILSNKESREDIAAYIGGHRCTSRKIMISKVQLQIAIKTLLWQRVVHGVMFKSISPNFSKDWHSCVLFFFSFSTPLFIARLVFPV